MKMMKKANEDIAGGLTRRIDSLSNVTGANRSTALGQAGKLTTQRSNVMQKNRAQRDIKKRMQMNSTNEMIGNIGGRGSDGKAMGSAPRASSSSTYVGRRNDALSNLNRMAKKHDDRDHIDHAHALKAIDHAGNKLNKHGPDHAEYKKAYDAAKKKSAEAMKSESVKEATSAENNAKRAAMVNRMNAAKAYPIHKAKLKHHTDQHRFHTKKARVKFSYGEYDGITFTPYPDYFGYDTLSYVAIDTSGFESELATVTFNIEAVDDPPFADSYLDTIYLVEDFQDPISYELDSMFTDIDGLLTYAVQLADPNVVSASVWGLSLIHI